MERVLVVGFTGNIGGLESVVMNYYRKFDKNKVQLDFLYSTDTIAFEDEIKELGGKVYKIEAKHKNYFKYKKDLKEFFKKNGKKYSAIWVNYCNITNLDYFKLAKKYGIKKRIVHAHNSQNMGSKLRGILHKLNKRILPLYATDYWSCAIGASEWFYSKKIINSDKHLLINNAIDVNKYKYNEKTRNKVRKEQNWENKTVVGTVGRLHFQKNQSFAIDVFKEFKKIYDNAIFVIVGEGEERANLEEKIKNEGLEDSVFLYGIRNDVPELQNGFDIVLFPSLFEGLSLSSIEFQCAGLITITSNTVASETKMSDYIYFLDLNDSPKKWASFMDKKLKEFDRKNAKNQIAERGFDINKEAKKIQDRLL